MILPFFLLGYAVIVQSAEYNRMEVFKNVEGCVDQDKFVKCYTGNGGVGRKNGVHMCSVDAICPKADHYWTGRDYLWETTREPGFDSLGCDDFILGGHCVELKFPLSIDKVNKPLTYLAGDYSEVFSQEWKTGTTALITNNPGTLLTPPTSTNVISWWGNRYTHRFDGKVDHEHYTITAASATVALLPEITKAKDSTPTPTTTATFNLSMSHRPPLGGSEIREVNTIALVLVSALVVVLVA
ncbi:uncharacterized protein RAG0_15422 [Rhynchosporium agropyri]|uniref:Uncharacterized protein n=1 Tax=Rhynchosporium agropyri TaxID=914238 RepID=A0A1E1LL28_9HELO|nr:uncharacterized protein RAG0_15422 [Rhynchosporium agropyri]